MRSILLFILMVGVAPASVQAQEMVEQRIKSIRAATFAEELQLTKEESKVFWPLYDAYDEERQELQQTYRKLQRQLNVVSDEGAREKISTMLDIEEQQVVIKRKYFEKFLEVLPVRKVAQIPRAERAFKKALLDRLKERRRN